MAWKSHRTLAEVSILKVKAEVRGKMQRQKGRKPNVKAKTRGRNQKLKAESSGSYKAKATDRARNQNLETGEKCRGRVQWQNGERLNLKAEMVAEIERSGRRPWQMEEVEDRDRSQYAEL